MKKNDTHCSSGETSAAGGVGSAGAPVEAASAFVSIFSCVDMAAVAAVEVCTGRCVPDLYSSALNSRFAMSVLSRAPR